MPQFRSRRHFAGLLAGGLATVAGLPVLARTRAKAVTEADVSKLYDAAKKEGVVIWWTAQTSVGVAESIRDAFRAKYPGVEVQLIRQTGQVVYQRLMQDLKANVHQLDVFSTSDEAHCVTLKKQNVLAEFVPADLERMPKQFQNMDPDNTYQLSHLQFVLVDYHDKRVSNPPRKWTDLGDPRWKGQIVVGHPGFSGTVGNWVVAMNDKYGWDYFKALEANQPKINRSLLDAVPDIIAGERLVAAGPYDLALQKRAEGHPINVNFPSDDAIAVFEPSAVLREAPHPNAARLFMNFFYSPEFSEVDRRSWIFPLRAGVAAADGRRLNTIKYYRSSADRLLTGIPEVVAKWRETFGV